MVLTTFSICVFPKVRILIMFMGGGDLLWGGGADPQNASRGNKCKYRFEIPPCAISEYAPEDDSGLVQASTLLQGSDTSLFRYTAMGCLVQYCKDSVRTKCRVWCYRQARNLGKSYE